ncbi:MAG: HD domain-containing protein [Lachnospiraceae bacterium]|nr:HD domain-containing protein [Lachnospiraceae bacterium]
MECEGLSQQEIENVYAEMAHGIVVSNLAKLVAEELEMDTSFVTDITIAGVLHDIGKLRLNKYLNRGLMNKMVVEQMGYVRQHSRHSAIILMENNYSRKIVDAVYYHHENVDGSGYPDGLKGDEIPFMSRILRTCDVFAALTSDRPYRKAFDSETAINMMIDEFNAYDMNVLLAFQRVYHSEKYEKMKYLNYHMSDLQIMHLPRFVEEASSKD